MFQFTTFIVSSLVFTSALGWVVYRFVEKPMLRRYSGRLLLQPREAQDVS
jgi:peptidoglycan/LPS O-acetylase OafA/YrhL